MLDVVLPKLGGMGVLNAVSADPGLARYHTYVLVTAFPQVRRPPAIEDLLSGLAVPVLYKPFDMSALLEMIEQAASRLTGMPVKPEHQTPADV